MGIGYGPGSLVLIDEILLTDNIQCLTLSGSCLTISLLLSDGGKRLPQDAQLALPGCESHMQTAGLAASSSASLCNSMSQHSCLPSTCMLLEACYRVRYGSGIGGPALFFCCRYFHGVSITGRHTISMYLAHGSKRNLNSSRKMSLNGRRALVRRYSSRFSFRMRMFLKMLATVPVF